MDRINEKLEVVKQEVESATSLGSAKERGELIRQLKMVCLFYSNVTIK